MKKIVWEESAYLGQSTQYTIPCKTHTGANSSNSSSEAMSKIFAFWAPRRSRHFGQSIYRDHSLSRWSRVSVCVVEHSMNF